VVAIAGTTREDVWLLGSEKLLGHFENGVWTTVDLPEFGTDLAVAPSGAVWVTDVSGAVRSYDGATLGVLHEFQNGPLRSLDVFGDGSAWVGGDSGFIAHYDGAAWQIHASPATGRVTGIYRANAQAVWFVTSTGQILRWDGATMTVDYTSAQPLHSVDGVDEDVWFVGNGGETIRYGGGVYVPTPTPTSRDLYAVWANVESDVWAAGDAGTVLRNQNGQWELFSTSVEAAFFSGWGADPGGNWLGASGATVYRYDGDGFSAGAPPGGTINSLWIAPGGETWAVHEGRVAVNRKGFGWTSARHTPVHNAISGVADDEIWVAADLGIVWRYDGSLWSSLDTGLGVNLEKIWAQSASDVYAASANALYHYDGGTWAKISLPGVTDILSVDGSASDDVWVVAKPEGTVYHFDGVVWTASQLDGAVRDSWGPTRDRRWFVSFDKIYFFNGTTYDSTVLPNAGLVAVAGVRDDRVFAISESGTVWEGGVDGFARRNSLSGGVFRVLDARGASVVAGGNGLVHRRDHSPKALYGGVCAEPTPIACGSRYEGALSGTEGNQAATCGAMSTPGSQRHFRLPVPVAGTVSVRVDAGPGGELNLSLRGEDGTGGCDVKTCLGVGENDTLSVSGSPGDVIFISIENPAQVEAAYTLEVSCSKER